MTTTWPYSKYRYGFITPGPHSIAVQKSNSLPCTLASGIGSQVRTADGLGEKWT